MRTVKPLTSVRTAEQLATLWRLNVKIELAKVLLVASAIATAFFFSLACGEKEIVVEQTGATRVVTPEPGFTSTQVQRLIQDQLSSQSLVRPCGTFNTPGQPYPASNECDFTTNWVLCPPGEMEYRSGNGLWTVTCYFAVDQTSDLGMRTDPDLVEEYLFNDKTGRVQ